MWSSKLEQKILSSNLYYKKKYSFLNIHKYILFRIFLSFNYSFIKKTRFFIGFQKLSSLSAFYAHDVITNEIPNMILTTNSFSFLATCAGRLCVFITMFSVGYNGNIVTRKNATSNLFIQTREREESRDDRRRVSSQMQRDAKGRVFKGKWKYATCIRWNRY